MATDIAAWSSRAHANLLGSGGAYYNGYLYQAGGEDTGGVKTTVRYCSVAADGTLGTWTATTSLPAARDYPAVAVCNGYLYVAGGLLNATTQYDTVYYAQIAGDGTVGAWSTGTALPGNRGYADMVSDGFGHLVFVGGYTTNTPHATVWTCTPSPSTGANGAWTVQTALPVNRYAHKLAISGGYIFLLGGNSFGAYRSEVYRTTINSSGTTGTWTSTTALPATRAWGLCFAFSGTLYWLAGTNGTNQSAVYYADPSLADGSISAWSTSSNPYPVAGAYQAMGVRQNGRISAYGGYAATWLANEYKTYLPELTVVVP